MIPFGRVRESLRYDTAFWRKAAWWGAARGPEIWLRSSPPAIGLLFALLMKSQRNNVRRNLMRAVGSGRGWRTELDVARTFVTFAQSLADSLALSGDKGYVPTIDVHGLEHLNGLVLGSRGVIVVTAHTAGWETSLIGLRKVCDRPVLVVMEGERDLAARDLHDSWRQRLGCRIIHVGRDPWAALPLLGHLRSGGIVSLQIDRCPAAARSYPAQFFGSPWRIPEGPLRIASLTGCPILPVFASRQGFLSYLVRISPPLHVPRQATASAVRDVVDEIVRVLELFIREHPTQWFHFVDDW